MLEMQSEDTSAARDPLKEDPKNRVLQILAVRLNLSRRYVRTLVARHQKSPPQMRLGCHNPGRTRRSPALSNS